VKLFRRSKNFTDDELIDAWVRGEIFLKVNDLTPELQAKLMAALDEASAAVEPTPPAPAVEVARRGAQPAQEERPAGFPPDECRCGGHIGWIDRGDHWNGTCHRCETLHFRGKHGPIRSIAGLIEHIDILQQENKRLRSELNQAIAQRDIARAQRDEARATGGNGRMSP
jgi:hypothetical protein